MFFVQNLESKKPQIDSRNPVLKWHLVIKHALETRWQCQQLDPIPKKRIIAPVRRSKVPRKKYTKKSLRVWNWTTEEIANWVRYLRALALILLTSVQYTKIRPYLTFSEAKKMSILAQFWCECTKIRINGPASAGLAFPHGPPKHTKQLDPTVDERSSPKFWWSTLGGKSCL